MAGGADVHLPAVRREDITLDLRRGGPEGDNTWGRGGTLLDVWGDLTVLLAFAVAMVILGVWALHRGTAA